MPPKAKFTREEVLSAALNIAENNGIKALTARSLGSALGSSARPIFTLYSNMEEVKSEVMIKANAVYGEYVSEGLKQTPAFKGVGLAYIRFASEKPKLFNLLFMSERESVPDVNSVLGNIESYFEQIISSITETYNVNRETALELYKHLWIYSHGIAVLIATKMCRFTEEQISSMLTETFTALLVRFKSGRGA